MSARFEQDADANVCNGANGQIRRASIIPILGNTRALSSRVLPEIFQEFENLLKLALFCQEDCSEFSKNLKIF